MNNFRNWLFEMALAKREYERIISIDQLKKAKILGYIHVIREENRYGSVNAIGRLCRGIYYWLGE